MKIKQIFENQANFDRMAKDPRTSKLLSITFKQDHTIPPRVLAKLGPKPTDEEIVKEFGHLVNQVLSNTTYGDVSQDGKFDEWITRQYMNGSFEFEDLSGQASDTLGAWKALSKRGLLDEKYQDFNKFTLGQLQQIVRKYSNELQRIANQEKLEQAKRGAKGIILIDNDRFTVAIPVNYGACYVFNNAQGVQATFCTGGSSGLDWFKRYADEGPILMVIDKANLDDIKGKWQIHAPTNQIVDSTQRNRYSNPAAEFGELFPGLMNDITKAMKSKAQEIHDASKVVPNNSKGYDVDKAIQQLREKFPAAFTEPADQEKADNGQSRLEI